MGQRQKKPKFKKRRSLSREELFPGKVRSEDPRYYQMKSSIEQVFSDPVERQAYIQSLVEKMEEPPNEDLVR